MQKAALLTLCTAAVSLWIWNELTHVTHFKSADSFEVRFLQVVVVFSAITPIALVGLSIWRRPARLIPPPAYAMLQGAFFGFFAVACEHSFPGVVMQVICLTCAICFTLALFYLNGLVVTSTPFCRKMLFALAGIPVYFAAAFLLTNLGFNFLPVVLHGQGATLCCIVAIIAAATFVSVFDLAARYTSLNTPLTWSGTPPSASTVSLVWLYLEGLRLFVKDRIPPATTEAKRSYRPIDP